MDLNAFPNLRELVCSMREPDGLFDMQSVTLYGIPGHLSMLKNLEVLLLHTHAAVYPCSKWAWDERLFAHLPHLSKLTRFGGVLLSEPLGVPVDLPQLQWLHGCFAPTKGEHDLLSAAACPQLQHLVLDLSTFSDVLMQHVASLTGLTKLQLRACGTPAPFDWDHGLDLVGHSLKKLVYLGLVNCHVQYQPEDAALHPEPLVLPGLSSFTQIKQLQLVCAMSPDAPPPEQPSSAQLLTGVSGLTQLEVLQLEGFSTLSPECVVGIVKALPQLQVMEVGLCRHPDLIDDGFVGEEARKAAAEKAGWEEMHSGFVAVGEQCHAVCPKLSVKVGYALQWDRAVG